MGTSLVIVWDQEVLGFIVRRTPPKGLSQIELSIFTDDTSTSQGPREIVLKKHPVFIPMPIAFAPIFNPIVDHHLVATTKDEPIEDVDPVTPQIIL